ncbi:MATE family efflux transporter [Cytobacillus oceanisediminis]|uniref:MATE family efflux transporter n=1 Tax=Cytobacillus oceanisediminis TaxID=665099 RepID=UPI0016429E5B|nr:MATE family efflux transporter [Cytobacillus oceanisediminis]
MLGILSNFLLVGLVYRYLISEELNGIWLTISSILTWITFFDFGMGNSLRNKLTESITNKNGILSNMYISTTYILMIFPTLIIIIISITVAFLFDWRSFFNIHSTIITNYYLALFISIVSILYSLNFYLSILNAILHAIYKSYLISGIQLLVNIINIVIISALLFLNIRDLILLGFFYIGTSVISLIISTVLLFKFNKYELKFSFKYFNGKLIKDIFNLGLKFLVLQLAIIVLFNTDNVLISKFVGVEQVATYQLVNKLLSLNTIVLGILLTPIWTKIIKDHTNRRFEEIKGTINKLLIIFFVLIIGVMIIGFFSTKLINLWVGSNLHFPNKLIKYMVVFTILHMWCNIFQSILNGINKLKVQVYSYGIATIINIPLSIFLVKNTGLGVSAIILGTIFSLLLPSFILPLYTIGYFKKITIPKR